jgi:hypothetical protein
MVTQPELRRRVEASVADLDDAIRLIRQAIFGLENRMATRACDTRSCTRAQDGIAIEVEPVADGTRLAWSVSLHP